MEARFNADFKSVRFHDGPAANRLAERIGAEAFTIGRDIFFRSPFTGDLKILAHELTHVVQCGRRAVEKNLEPVNSPAEVEAELVAARVCSGQSAGQIRCSLSRIARTATSAAVIKLISYSATDWLVTTEEERQVLTLLAGDPTPQNTFDDLKKAGMVNELIDRIDGDDERNQLVQILAGKLDDATVDGLGSTVLYITSDLPLCFIMEVSHDLQTSFRAMGLTSSAPVFNTAGFAHLIGKTKTAPFGGSGATGLNPTKLAEIPKLDQAGMAAGIKSIRAKYHNPVGGLTTYLSSLSISDRSGQAELLLRQPISSVVPYSYTGKIPSRADVMKAAAVKYNLHGAAIAAFILAEQRDQSTNEDAKDYQSAASIVMAYNSSIGLGQVVVSTARKNDLFSDLLRSKTRKSLQHWQIAMLLASDDFNIFAAAKYIRKTADAGAAMTAAKLPQTAASWPNIDFSKYSQNSRTWPEDNIAALGSEYTSTPWDDNVTAWGDFVVEAYRDVTRSGVF